MALESGTFVNDLVTGNPQGSDYRSTSDDHQRLIKSTLRNTFPNADAPQALRYVEASGTNTYAVTLSPAPTGYAAGMFIRFRVANTNTSAAVSLNVNSLGAIDVQLDGEAPEVGDFVAGDLFGVVYDSALAKFQVVESTKALKAAMRGSLLNKRQLYYYSANFV